MSDLPIGLVGKLTHEAVISWLRSRGAQTIEPGESSGDTLRLSLNGVVAYVSTDPSLPGYHESLASVVRWANENVQAHPDGLLGQFLDLVMGKGDVFRFRLDEESVVAGTIPFGRADRLVSFTRSAIEESERSWISKLRSDSAKAAKALCVGDWSQECRLGQTEEGSYVIKVHCPLGLRFTEHERNETFLPTIMDEMDDKGFGRAISLHLLESLDHIHGMAEARDPSWVKSDEFKRLHVPIRLVRALSVAAPIAEGQLSISCNWSRTAKAPAQSKERILFERKHLPILEEAARMAAPTPDETGRQECSAMVAAVKADPNPVLRKVGEVTFLVMVGDKARMVHATLDRLRYDRAVEAHRLGRTLTVIGKLKQRGRTYHFDGDWDVVF
jgi:hypothetical protein